MRSGLGIKRSKPSDEGFDAVFDRIFPRAFKLAHRILGDPARAEDVAAEALARAFARWKELSELHYCEAWILRVAANLAIDATRERRPLLGPDVPIDIEEVATVRAALAAALRQLSRRQREAVVLRYLGGLSDSEVAAVMEISHGAVKSHLARGIATLRKLLGTMVPEGGTLNAR